MNISPHDQGRLPISEVRVCVCVHVCVHICSIIVLDVYGYLYVFGH